MKSYTKHDFQYGSEPVLLQKITNDVRFFVTMLSHSLAKNLWVLLLNFD